MITISILWMLIANNLYLINYFSLVLLTVIACILLNGQLYITNYMLYNTQIIYNNLSYVILLIGLIIAVWLIFSYANSINRINFNNELLTFIMLLLIAMIALITSNSYIAMFVSIEIQSLVLYIMFATNINQGLINTNTNKISLSYLINAAMATALLLLGMSLNSNVLIIIAVLWKLGVIPLHVWSLPILDNQHYIIVSIYLTITKFGILFTLMLLTSNNTLSTELLTFIGLINLVIGNIIGIMQYRFKRIIVYSSLIQIGYILLIIGYSNSLALTYFAMYSIFTIMLLLNWIFPIYHITSAIQSTSNIILYIMIIVLYTVAGLPYFPIFWSKLDIILEIQSETLIIALIGTLFSSLIYIRLIKYLTFFKFS